ncbi:MAG: hypothetical protein RBS68_10400 [Anaerolineales bacterium]|jgi:hypothetical protein|nr:hypothetical protein [Anaerolineales bacterium]
MSQELLVAFETGFNVLYLFVIWVMVILMSRNLPRVEKKSYQVANLFRWAFVLLAIGDTGHVGFRVWAYARGGVEQNGLLVGLGALATAVTITFFYVMMLYIWKERNQASFGWFEYFLLGTVPIRLLVMAFPENEWGNASAPEFWGPFRNIFLMILGLGVMYLILRDALKSGDRLFRWIGYCIFFSYLFYTPVIFFVRQYPLLGMLMIPKTIMYIAIAVLAYVGLWKKTSRKKHRRSA